MADRSQPDTSPQSVLEDWRRVDLYIDLLATALADQAGHGGVAGVAEVEGWSRDRISGVADRLATLRAGIEVELSRLDANLPRSLRARRATPAR